MKPVSMRTRLTLWFSCTVGVLLSLSGVVYILSTRSTLGDRALSELVEELGEIAREARQHQTKSAFLPEVTKRFYDHGVGTKGERVHYEFVVNDDRDRRIFKSSKVRIMATRCTHQVPTQTGTFSCMIHVFPTPRRLE